MKTTFKHEPALVRKINGGIQKLYRFENGYGASVVRHQFSYGAKSGCWELAVTSYESADSPLDHFSLSYETPITDDVIGYLSESDAEKLLAEISALPSKSQ